MIYLAINKSKVAPTSFNELNDYVIVGEKFIRILSVIRLPEQFNLALLSFYINNPKVKVYVKMDRIQEDLNKILRDDYERKLQELNRTKDKTYQMRLQNELMNLNDYIQENIRRNDAVWNFYISMMIVEDSKKALDDLTFEITARIRNNNIFTKKLLFLQQGLFKYATGLFISSGLGDEIEKNLGVPLPSTSVAGLYPFVFETMKDKKGFLFGYESSNGGAMIVDPFLYLNEKERSVAEDRLNGNIIVVGSSGAGKSTAMYLFIRYFIKETIKTIWIDPESQNEKLTRKYGQFIDWGTEQARINIFDLKPITTENDVDDDHERYNTKLAIYNNVEDLKIVLQYVFPTIDEDILAILGDLVMKMYVEKGIQPNASFKHLGVHDYPTFTDLYNVVDSKITALEESKTINFEYDLLIKLRIKLKVFIVEYSMYFDGHTTIDVADEFLIGFGTKKLEGKSDNLVNALNHIMFQFAWSLCSDKNYYSSFVLDEAHKFLKTPISSKYISSFQRRSRKYHNSTIIATQEVHDFADQTIISDGKAIFNNAANKIIMKLQTDGVADLNRLIKVTDSESHAIEYLQQGDCILILGNKHSAAHVFVTNNELEEMLA